MRDSAITDYFTAIKQEPVIETELFDLNASSEYTSTVIKSEQQCFIKEEIDIPDFILSNRDRDSLCTKPCTDLANRTCSIVINRLSSADVQKYFKTRNQNVDIIEETDCSKNANKDNVENLVNKNQQTEIIKNNGKRNLRKHKRNDITKFNTRINKEDIENLDANSEQKEVIEDNGGEEVRNPIKDELDVSELCTSPSEQNKQISHIGNKQKEISTNNCEKRVKNREKTDITKFFTSLSKEAIPLLENSMLENSVLENSDTNNGQDKTIKNDDEKDAKRRYNRYSVRDGPLTTEFYKSFCPKCEKKYKTRTTIVKCSDCKIRLMYECKKCHKQLGSHNGMGNHVRTSCISQGYYYECFKCGFKSPLRSYVFIHLKRVHPNSFFPERIERVASKEIHADVAPAIDECSKCGQQFSALHKLVKHVLVCNGSKDSKEHASDYAASKDKILRYCSKCDETIKDVGTDKKKCSKCQIVLAFKCSICQKLYTSCCGIINHIVKSHNEKEWRCSKCDFKTHSMTSLTSHYKRMHNPKVFECTKCRKTWKSREHLLRHLRKCGVKPNLHCAYCSYKTCLRLHLQLHISKVHPQEDESVGCPKCQKNFKNNDLLKIHLRTTCEKEANILCEHCSFKTKFKRSITRHILRRHSAGSNYECPKCKYQLKNNTSLKKHLLVCGIERSLQCKMCSYKTYTKQYLKCHIRNKHQSHGGFIS